MTQVLKNKKGVTLVELLAVIVIMGIIAAIAVPAIGGLIENSQRKAIEGGITTVEEAARLYATTADDTTDVSITVLQTYVSEQIDFTGSTITFTVVGTSVTFANGGAQDYFTISNGDDDFDIIVVLQQLEIS